MVGLALTDKQWGSFLEWLYKTHSITKDWIPDKISIQLWEEYRVSASHPSRAKQK